MSFYEALCVCVVFQIKAIQHETQHHITKYVSNTVCILFFQYNKHLFVHIGQTNHSYSDALLESVDIRQIYDKFPEKKGGLKELYGKGPQNSFFLIKFWVSMIFQPQCYSLIIFYTHQPYIIATLCTL